jgi:uncharacterized ParB-like nuclease family protein
MINFMPSDNITFEEVLTDTTLQAKLSYMANKLNIPVQEVRRAVAAVGNDPERIQAYLEQYGK